MGNIKIEFELPEFQNELVVSVTLKRDGETIVASSSTEGVRTAIDETGTAWKQGTTAPAPKKTTKKTTSTTTPTTGNFMDMNF